MPRFFAIVPAAGQSSRMGEPKLLLPLAGEPLMARVLRAWQASAVDHVIAVVRPGDERLAEIVRAAGVELVIPAAPPPDMKASIQAALRHIETQHAPTAEDAFLVAPADMPRLSSSVTDALLRGQVAGERQILVPTIAGRRGHPVLFPWTLAAHVHALAGHEGLDALVRRHQPRAVLCDGLPAGDASSFVDIDTPEDYQQLR
jgi:molybdenum cofactor cytidylyltransferase